MIGNAQSVIRRQQTLTTRSKQQMSTPQKKTNSHISSSVSVTHKYVDLGLPSGTLWATCNLEASKASDYGLFFAWGETSAKSHFLFENYKFLKGSIDGGYTKYRNQGEPFDGKKELDIIDDAAYKIWGSDWRIPSKEQFEELVSPDYTTLSWTTLNGIEGLKITSISNENYVFLPGASWQSYRTPPSRKERCHCSYWTRSIFKAEDRGASVFDCDKFGVHTTDFWGYGGYGEREFGHSIRPVRIK